jgi:hypothetical protein
LRKQGLGYYSERLIEDEMIDSAVNCPCLNAFCNSCNNKDHLIQEFETIRNQCPAIREILVPDEIWKEFIKKTQEEYDKARHNYIVLLAFKYGHLFRLTYPIHKYLLENNKPRPNLNPNYKKDLQERWMLGDTDERRHELFKRYQGKLTELRCALWLQEQGWIIDNLEALGGLYDIEATSPEGIECAIEVKFIGLETDKFQATINENGGNFDPSSDADYLLYIAYTAAKKLKQTSKKTIAIIVSGVQDWTFKKTALELGYVDLNRPRFYDDNRDFIEREEYPDFDNDLPIRLSNLNELWIVSEGSNYNYTKEYPLITGRTH